LEALKRLAEVLQPEMSLIEPREGFTQSVMARLPQRRVASRRPLLAWASAVAVLLIVSLLVLHHVAHNPTVPMNKPDIITAHKPGLNPPAPIVKPEIVTAPKRISESGQKRQVARKPSAPKQVTVPIPEPVAVPDEPKTVARYETAAPSIELARVPIGEERTYIYEPLMARAEPKSRMKIVADPMTGSLSIGVVQE
jgi:hypothetical protein